MPRPTHETSREPATRATPDRRDRAADVDRQDAENAEAGPAMAAYDPRL